MTAQSFGPLRYPPRRIRPPFDVHGGGVSDVRRNDKEAALLEALDGIELGAHDRRIIVWLAEWEIETVGTIVSLLYRARTAGGS